MAEPQPNAEQGAVWPLPVAWAALAMAVFPGGGRPAWHAEAACAGLEDPDIFDGAKPKPAQARRVCEACPVRRECLRDAIGWETGSGTRAAHPWGVRAGMLASERAALYRKMPGSVGAPGKVRRRPRRR